MEVCFDGFGIVSNGITGARRNAVIGKIKNHAHYVSETWEVSFNGETQDVIQNSSSKQGQNIGGGYIGVVTVKDYVIVHCRISGRVEATSMSKRKPVLSVRNKSHSHLPMASRPMIVVARKNRKMKFRAETELPIYVEGQEKLAKFVQECPGADGSDVEGLITALEIGRTQEEKLNMGNGKRAAYSGDNGRGPKKKKKRARQRRPPVGLPDKEIHLKAQPFTQQEGISRPSHTPTQEQIPISMPMAELLAIIANSEPVRETGSSKNNRKKREISDRDLASGLGPGSAGDDVLTILLEPESFRAFELNIWHVIASQGNIDTTRPVPSAQRFYLPQMKIN